MKKTGKKSLTKKLPANPIQRVAYATQGFYHTAEETEADAVTIIKESFDIQEKLDKERIREIQSKAKARKLLTTAFILLLFLQNSLVFYIVYQAFLANKLKDLEIIFSTLIAATLTETYFVIKIIVNYTFKADDYVYKNQS